MNSEITSNKPEKNPARVAAGKKLADYNKALKSNPPPTQSPPPDNGGDEGEGNYYTTIIVLAGLGYYMLSNSEGKGAVKKDVVKKDAVKEDVVKEDVVKGSKLRKFNN